MSREKPNSRAPGAHEFDEVLRRPDGSVDIAAYTKIAHRERAVAVTSSTRETFRKLHEMVSATMTRLASVVRSRPASGKHHAAASRVR
ncbi:MAG: hypothetical protein Q8M18_01240 [Bradyrhizobium sp.]|nr:hypothetical protein [Bradyrhizobium sp.]